MNVYDSDNGSFVGKMATEGDVNSTPSERALSEAPPNVLNSSRTLEKLSSTSPAVSLKSQLNSVGGTLSTVLAVSHAISPTLEQSLRLSDAARLSDAFASTSVVKAVEEIAAGIERYQEAFRSSAIMKSVEAISAGQDKWQEALRNSPLIKAVEAINTGVEKYQEAFQASALLKTVGAIGVEMDKYRGALENLSAKISDEFIRPFQQLQTSLSQAANVALTPYLAAFEVAESFSKQLQRTLEPIERISNRFASLPQLELTQFEGWFERFSSQLQRQWNGQERRIYKLLTERGFAGLESYSTLRELNHIFLLSKKKRTTKKRAVHPVDAYVFSIFKRNNYKLLNMLVRRWWRVPYMASRKKAIRSALKAHKNRQYELAIPALLPLIDGLCALIVDGTPNLPSKTMYVREVAEQYREQEDEVWGECVEQIINALVFRQYKFSTAKKPPSSVNRHGILHGRVVGYGSSLL